MVAYRWRTRFIASLQIIFFHKRLRDACRLLFIIGRKRTVNYQAQQVFFDRAQPGTRRATEERHELVAIQWALDRHTFGFFFETLAAFGQLRYASDGS